MRSLIPCPSCQRHVESTETACPFCETALVPDLQAVANAGGGRNWEIPNVVLGDSLISDVDRAVITVHHQLGRKFHLLRDQ